MRLFFFLFLGMFANVASGQTYALQSFEGGKEQVNLYYKPASGTLTISHAKDTLRIDDYWVVDTTEVLDNVFLKIDYVKRTGTNLGLRNLVLLYVSNGRLGQALHVESYREWDMRPKEYSLFKLTADLTGHDPNTYKLMLRMHNEKGAKQDDKTGVLSFDKQRKVFYSGYENYGRRKHVPVVVVGKDRYYYIKGAWFDRYEEQL